jgi:hypothetical protein
MKKILFFVLISFASYGQGNFFDYTYNKVYTASGTNTYSISQPKITGYYVGLNIYVKFTNGNTTASSLQINSLGNISLLKLGSSSLSSGDITAGETKLLIYDGTNFLVLNIAGSGGGGGSWLLASGGTLTGANTITTTGANDITFNQSALGAGNGFVINSNSTDATANTQTAFRVNQSGANANASQTTFGGYFSNTKTGTTNTNVGLYSEASGATNNIAIQAGAGVFLAGTSLPAANPGSYSSVSTLNAADVASHYVNTNAGSSASSQSRFSNNSGSAFIRINSSTNIGYGGVSSFNIVNELSAPIVLATANLIRYTIGSSGQHTFTGSAGAAYSLFNITQQAHTSGTPTGILFTGGVHNGIVASETNDVNFNGNRTVTFAGSTGFATQRTNIFRAPTYNFASPTGTITTAATVSITGAPGAGGNAAITNPLALWTESGAVRFDAPSSVMIANAAGDTPTASTRFDLRGLSGGTNIERLATSANTERFAFKDAGGLAVGGSEGTAGQVLTSGGAGAPVTWTTGGGGGISNTAAANEFMKSDGTNAVPSGVFSSVSSNLELGNISASGSTRNITAFSSSGNTNLQVVPEGTGIFIVNSLNPSIFGQSGTGAFLVSGGLRGSDKSDISPFNVVSSITVRGGSSTTALDNAGNVSILSGTPGAGGAEGSVNIQTRATGKLGFFNATPVVKQSAVSTSQGIADVLTAYGLLPSSTISGGGGGLTYSQTKAIAMKIK